MRKIFLSAFAAVLFCVGLRHPAQAARYISLAPSSTEILFALGLDEQVVGVSSFCDYPPQALQKEIVGTFSLPNIEKIVSLKPDIVFCAGIEQAPVSAKLSQLGIKVAAHEPRSIEQLLDSIKQIGEITSRQQQAQALVKKMQEAIEKVKGRSLLIAENKKPSVFVEYWNSPLMTAGPGSFIDELIVLAGGRNIAYDLPRPYCNFSPEAVLNRDPDCIILAYMIADDVDSALKNRFGWSKLKAVKNHRVYADIDPDLLLRPGPRIIEGLEKLQKHFYPDK